MTKRKSRPTACEQCAGSLPDSLRVIRYCSAYCRDRHSREKNRARRYEQTVAWHRANPERRKAIQAQYRARHRNKINATARENTDGAALYRAKLERYGPEQVAARNREQRLFARYSITVAQYERMSTDQDGRCAICRKPERAARRLAVDHDRSCCPGRTSCGECVRALLCTWCNNRLSALEHTDWMENAMAYLKAHKR